MLGGITECSSVPKNQDSIDSDGTQPHKTPSKDRLVIGDEDHDINQPEEMTLQKEVRTASPELNLEILRYDLHMLVVGELSHGAQSPSKDPEEMWEVSQEINLSLKEVWTADKKELELEMGAEKYRIVDRVISEWLVWRGMTRKLDSVAGIYPSQGLLPLLADDQWTEKLGEKHEVQAMDLWLATYRRFLHSSGSVANTEDFAELFATGLSFAIKFSLVVESFVSRYKENILAFNEKLFSWPFDFAPRKE